MAALRVLAFTAIVFGFTQLKPDWFPPKDFVEYWSAATVHAHGGNPYDGSQLLVVQQAVEIEEFEKKKARGTTSEKETFKPKTQAVSLWTPPWTLPLYLPFGFLPFALAHQAWLIVQLICLGAAVELLGIFFSPSPPTPLPPRERGARMEFGYLLLILFSPVFWDLHFGQNTAFILLGLAGFLRFRETKPWLAGAFVALTAIKPHLLAPFGILLVADAIRPVGRKVLTAGIAVLVAGSLMAIAFDSCIFAQFLEAVRKPSTPDTVSLKDWQVPLVSYHLRQAVNPAWFWVQFLPCLAMCLAAACYYGYRWRNWNWIVELPRLVIVSLLAAPYGAWIFDLTLLIVPLIAGTSMVLRSGTFLPPMIFILGLLGISVWALKFEPLDTYWWFTPAFLLLYVMAEFVHRKESSWRGIIAS